jgi:hypothetical protein
MDESAPHTNTSNQGGETCAETDILLRLWKRDTPVHQELALKILQKLGDNDLDRVLRGLHKRWPATDRDGPGKEIGEYLSKLLSLLASKQGELRILLHYAFQRQATDMFRSGGRSLNAHKYLLLGRPTDPSQSSREGSFGTATPQSVGSPHIPSQ